MGQGSVAWVGDCSHEDDAALALLDSTIVDPSFHMVTFHWLRVQTSLILASMIGLFDFPGSSKKAILPLQEEAAFHEAADLLLFT